MLLEQGMIALPVHDPGHAIGDQKMLTLPLALDPLHMARVRRELMDAPASAAQRGRARPAWTLQAIQVRRHKPGRRCLIEYELLEPASGKQLSLLGKIRAKGLDRTSYQVQEALWRNGFDEASPDGISVPEPLGYVPHLAMWLQKKVAAHPVITGLDGADGLALARRIAEAVHKLHRLGPPPGRVHG